VVVFFLSMGWFGGGMWAGQGRFFLFFFLCRYTVRECSASRKVGDRMKVFRKFLPLFDEPDS